MGRGDPDGDRAPRHTRKAGARSLRVIPRPRRAPDAREGDPAGARATPVPRRPLWRCSLARGLLRAATPAPVRRLLTPRPGCPCRTRSRPRGGVHPARREARQAPRVVPSATHEDRGGPAGDPLPEARPEAGGGGLARGRFVLRKRACVCTLSPRVGRGSLRETHRSPRPSAAAKSAGVTRPGDAEREGTDPCARAAAARTDVTSDPPARENAQVPRWRVTLLAAGTRRRKGTPLGSPGRDGRLGRPRREHSWVLRLMGSVYSTNLADKPAYAQQLVTTRLLDCLHDRVRQLSRMQRIYPCAL